MITKLSSAQLKVINTLKQNSKSYIIASLNYRHGNRIVSENGHTGILYFTTETLHCLIKKDFIRRRNLQSKCVEYELGSVERSDSPF